MRQGAAHTGSVLAAAVTLAAAGGAPARRLGLVVESVPPGGSARKAGLRPRDKLLSWTCAKPAFIGQFSSPLGLLSLEIDVSPLGPATLHGLGGDEEFSAEAPPGDWRIEARSGLSRAEPGGRPPSIADGRRTAPRAVSIGTGRAVPRSLPPFVVHLAGVHEEVPHRGAGPSRPRQLGEGSSCVIS